MKQKTEIEIKSNKLYNRFNVDIVFYQKRNKK